jgi:hypothetical protein
VFHYLDGIAFSLCRHGAFSYNRPSFTGRGVFTAFGCADARGIITYNGVEWDDAQQTPSDWLMQLGDVQPFRKLSLDQLLTVICADTQRRIEHLSPAFTDRRHTFIVAAWRNNEPSVYTISPA